MIFVFVFISRARSLLDYYNCPIEKCYGVPSKAALFCGMDYMPTWPATHIIKGPNWQKTL